jgi:prevent-host-death family protein
MYPRIESLPTGGEVDMPERDDTPPVSAVEARRGLTDLVNRVAEGHQRVVISRYGRPAAALIPAEDLEILERLEDEVDREIHREVKREIVEQGTVGLAEVKRRLKAGKS